MASAPDGLGGVDDLVHHQVGLGGGVAAQRIGLVGKPDVQGIAVRVGVDGYGGDALVAGGADDADRDFTAVGDQHLGEAGVRGTGGLLRNLLTRRLLLSFREPSAILEVPPILLADSACKATQSFVGKLQVRGNWAFSAVPRGR